MTKRRDTLLFFAAVAFCLFGFALGAIDDCQVTTTNVTFCSRYINYAIPSSSFLYNRKPFDSIEQDNLARALVESDSTSCPSLSKKSFACALHFPECVLNRFDAAHVRQLCTSECDEAIASCPGSTFCTANKAMLGPAGACMDITITERTSAMFFIVLGEALGTAAALMLGWFGLSYFFRKRRQLTQDQAAQRTPDVPNRGEFTALETVVSDAPPAVRPDDLVECRICKSESPAKELLAPCNCQGSMSRVHAACLQQWVETGTRPEPMRCEVCLQEYQVNIVHKFMCSSSKVCSAVACSEYFNCIIISLVVPCFILVLWMVCGPTLLPIEAPCDGESGILFGIGGGLVLGMSLLTLMRVYSRWRTAASSVVFVPTHETS